MSGEIVVAVVAGVAEDVGVDAAMEALAGSRSQTRLLDQDARAGEADLAGVVVLAGRLRGGRVEIGIGEDERTGSCRRARAVNGTRLPAAATPIERGRSPASR